MANRTELNQERPGAAPISTRGYGLHKRNNTGNQTLTIPIAISRLIPEGTRFSCELTDDGILFRPLVQVAIPDWIK